MILINSFGIIMISSKQAPSPIAPYDQCVYTVYNCLLLMYDRIVSFLLTHKGRVITSTLTR